MSPPAWAYQVDNFSPPPDDELVCSICQAVFCDPVQSPCHHVFCRHCIIKWLENNRNCPICRKRTTRTTLQEVVPLVKNMIMKLTLNCHNSTRGCEEKFSLESCESHVKDCPYELVQCKNKPCNLIFMKRDLLDHEQNNCPHSFVRCTTCQLKMPSRNPKVHNCIAELKKKLKGKTEKLKKSNEKIKKLEEELKRARDNASPIWSPNASSSDSILSSDSLSTADVLFSINDLSNGGSSSSESAASNSDDDSMWPFQTEQNITAEIDYQLQRMEDILYSGSPSVQVTDESIEYPRSSSPLRLADSSILEIEPTEQVLELESEVRRPPKRRLTTRILDTSDEENEGDNSTPLPSRKRTWHLPPEGGAESSTAAATSGSLDVAGPSYVSSTAESSTSTNDSSPSTNNRGRFRLRPKLRSRSAQQRSSTVSAANADSSTASLNCSPIFERTISLLEQYNLESDPDWLPTHAEDSLNDSDNELFELPGHITSSDESSITDLESESSYEDAAEGRTEDLLNSFYGSSDSDSDEWQPQ